MDHDENTESSSRGNYSHVAVGNYENMRCKKCNKIFNHISTLRRHLKNHEASECRGLKNEEYICTFCNKLYYHIRMYRTHMLKNHYTDTALKSFTLLENTSFCSCCHREFSDVNTLKSHFCGGLTKEKIPRKNSAEMEEECSFFDCAICCRQFYSRRSIISHLRQSHNFNPTLNDCKSCHKCFPSQASQFRHQNNQKDEIHLSKFKTPATKLCILRKNSQISVNTRVQEQENMNSQVINEEQIAEESSNRNELMSSDMSVRVDEQDTLHERVLSEESAGFVEQVMPLRGEQLVAEESNNMSNQIQPCQPSDERILYSNAQVPVSEQSKNSSIETEMINLDVPDVKSFPCTKCSRKFYTERTMQLHLDTHANLPQIHYCSLCNFSNEDQFAFSVHVLDHYKKKYKCDICNRLFYTKSTMELHVENHQSS